nr:hypothetical protein [Streptomyces sp. I5]
MVDLVEDHQRSPHGAQLAPERLLGCHGLIRHHDSVEVATNHAVGVDESVIELDAALVGGL